MMALLFNTVEQKDEIKYLFKTSFFSSPHSLLRFNTLNILFDFKYAIMADKPYTHEHKKVTRLLSKLENGQEKYTIFCSSVMYYEISIEADAVGLADSNFPYERKVPGW